MISQEVIEQSLREIQQTEEESERRFKEEQARRTGADPSRPWHPLFNPEAPPERTFGDYIRQREENERRKYADVWEEAIARVKAHQFQTRKALAAHYSQKPLWAYSLVRLMVKHRRLTADELRECLPGGRKTDPGAGCRGGTKRRSSARDHRKRNAEFMARLVNQTREDFEQVFLQRDSSLTFPLVLSMIKGRSFKSVTGFASHFFKGKYWGRAFGQFLARTGVMSLEDFRACFSDRRGRAGVAARRKQQQ